MLRNSLPCQKNLEGIGKIINLPWHCIDSLITAKRITDEIYLPKLSKKVRRIYLRQLTSNQNIGIDYYLYSIILYEKSYPLVGKEDFQADYKKFSDFLNKKDEENSKTRSMLALEQRFKDLFDHFLRPARHIF